VGVGVGVDVKNKRVEQTGAEQQAVSMNSNDSEEDAKKVLNVVVKADTLGSLEALIGSLERVKNEEARVKIVGKGLGNIMADDVTLANTTGAFLFGFSVTTTPIAQQMIKENSVKYEEYRVIYDLIDKIKLELEKMLNPELITTELGNFKVLQIFRTAKSTMVVGGRVESGKLFTDARVRVKRAGEIIGLGKITKLQSGKQEAKEVPGGSECGVEYNGKLKLEEGDILEAYKEEKKEKKLVLS
jgi:translation initiation factor IF-2